MGYMHLPHICAQETESDVLKAVDCIDKNKCHQQADEYLTSMTQALLWFSTFICSNKKLLSCPIDTAVIRALWPYLRLHKCSTQKIVCLLLSGALFYNNVQNLPDNKRSFVEDYVGKEMETTLSQFSDDILGKDYALKNPQTFLPNKNFFYNSYPISIK